VVALFKKIYNAVIKSYIDNKLAWMEDSEHSAIHILSKQDIKAMDEGEVQDIFCKQHVIVQDQFLPTIRKSWRCQYDQAEFVGTWQKWLLMPKSVQAISSHANYHCETGWV
jgi:hypothetical protein